MRRTRRTLNDYEMQHNEEVGLFTKPSGLFKKFPNNIGNPVLGIFKDIVACT